MSRVPIRVRVAAAFAVAMAVVLAATGVFLYQRLGDDLARSLDQELRLRAQDLSALVREPGGSLASESHGRLVERGESFAEVIDARGRTLDSTPPLGGTSLLSLPELRAAVMEFADRIDPATWHSPQMGMESTVLTVSLLARAGIARPRGCSTADDGDGWDAFLDLIEAVVTDAPAAELHELCQLLVSEHQPQVADLHS